MGAEGLARGLREGSEVCGNRDIVTYIEKPRFEKIDANMTDDFDSRSRREHHERLYQYYGYSLSFQREVRRNTSSNGKRQQEKLTTDSKYKVLLSRISERENRQ